MLKRSWRLRRDKTKTAQQKAKAEKEQKEAALAQAKALANALFNKGVDIETIAKIMEIDVKDMQKILKKKTK